MKKSIVYVRDGNGWENECPDYQGVFFGDLPDYVHPNDGGHTTAGHISCASRAEARGVLSKLNQRGDWRTDEGDEMRPVYAIADDGYQGA